MADPKLMRIMQTVKTRMETILVSNGFHTDMGQLVERYDRVFNEEETPASSITLSSAQQAGAQGDGVKTDPSLIIRASSIYTGIAEDLAIKMLADIHKAIEVVTNTIPQQAELFRRPIEQSWEIIYPENQDRLVSVEVVYSFSYSRKYGED